MNLYLGTGGETLNLDLGKALIVEASHAGLVGARAFALEHGWGVPKDVEGAIGMYKKELDSSAYQITDIIVKSQCFDALSY